MEMRRTLLFLVIIFLKPILSFSIDFYIDVLKYRNVKQLCLITSEIEPNVDINFIKKALSATIRVSVVNLARDEKDEKLNLCLQHRFVPLGVIVLGQYPLLENILEYASQYNLFNSMHYWLLEKNCNYIGNDTSLEVTNILERLNISVDADIILASEYGNSNNNHYVLYDVFNFGKIQGGTLVINEIGSWNPFEGLNVKVDLQKFKYYRRWDFQKLAMRLVLVSSLTEETFDMKKFVDFAPETGVGIITYRPTVLLALIADIHNISFKVTIVDRWVSTFERNSTRSVAKTIYFKEQDVSPIIRYQSNVNERLDILNPALFYIEIRYFYKIPTYGVGKFENQFLRPLSSGVWGCFIAVSLLCGLLLLAAARFESRPLSLQYAVFSVLASVCQQSRKFTVLVTGIACVLIYNYYTSSVVSWLLSGPPPSINSLEDLLNSPLELIYEDQGYVRSWLQEPTYYFYKGNAEVEDKIRQRKVYNKKKDAPLLVSLEKGIEMAKEGGYACHAELQSAHELISKTFTQDELCELGSLESIPKTDLYVCVQKRSPYKEFLSWSLLRLKERGIVMRVQRRANSLEVDCEGSSPRALALGGAAPAFILLAAGYMLAVLLLLGERLIFNIRHRSRF